MLHCKNLTHTFSVIFAFGEKPSESFSKKPDTPGELKALRNSVAGHLTVEQQKEAPNKWEQYELNPPKEIDGIDDNNTKVNFKHSATHYVSFNQGIRKEGAREYFRAKVSNSTFFWVTIEQLNKVRDTPVK